MTRQTTIERTHNIGLIAHIDAGKTTTTERMLYYTGRVYKIGEVDDGTATMDWMELEQERGITITSASTACFWKGHRINIIDTPGHVDFTVEVERTLKILDGCVVIFCGVGGVEPQSETVWRQADNYNIPRLSFINKMDRLGANFYKTIEEMEDRLGVSCIPIQIPFGKESEFKGIIDLVDMRVILYSPQSSVPKFETISIPHEYISVANAQRSKMIEKIAELQNDIMELYIQNQPLSREQIKEALRELTISNKITPVLCGASLKNIGIQPLIDAICDYLPSPIDIPSVIGINPQTNKKEERETRDDEDFSGLSFKIVSDPYVGKLTYIRVYSGILRAGTYVYNSNKKIKEKIGKILQMHANKQQQVKCVYAGDIAAVVGLKYTKTGDTICDESSPILLESIHFPEPVLTMAIEPKTRSDQEKLFQALNKIKEEDPSFKVSFNKDTGQTVISGMGELHLEIIIDRMLREFKVAAEVGKPKVAYRETITKEVESTGKFIQQSGGRGQYGVVELKLEPLPSGSGIKFENKVYGGEIPKEFIPSVEEGIMAACNNGCLANYPVTDIKVVLMGGSYHKVDSSELAFRMAASIGFTAGFKKGEFILIEPIMNLEVITPEGYLGEVIGDLNGRRSNIKSLREKLNTKIIKADVPLANMFGYATSLRSLTQGRATYTMEPSCYAPVPKHIQEEIVG